MQTINRNVIANVIGRGWSMLSFFIFIPIYINILGVKSYGIVSFFAILQGVLIFADAGLTAALKREMAKGSDNVESRINKYHILRSFEIIYFIIVWIIIFGIYFGAPLIVNNWLNIENLDIKSTILSVKLMGVALGFNFIATFYQGGILGLEKQIVSNALQVSWSLLKNIGVIGVLLVLNKSTIVFFGWHVIINIIYVLVLRYVLFSILKKQQKLPWQILKDFNIDKKIWKYAGGMFLLSIIAALNSQLDKLILSKYLSISELSIYTVAFSLAMMPIVIARPISTAVFPRLVNYIDSNQEKKLFALFNNSFRLTLLLSGGVGIILSIYSDFFLNLWIQNSEVAYKAALPASILLIGQIFLSFQIIPFNLAIANGNTKINLVTGGVGLIFFIPAIIFIAKSFGTIGVSITWLIYCGVLTPIYITLVLKNLTKFFVFSWFLNNMLKPISMLIFGNLFFLFFKPSFISNEITNFIYIALTSFIVFLYSFKYTFNIKIANILPFIKHRLLT